MARTGIWLSLTAALTLTAGLVLTAADADRTRVLEGKLPDDYRLGKGKDLNAYFPMAVPASKEAWEKRRQDVREQVLVGNGLWPLANKTAFKPVVHGKIDRDDYTIEKVFFASHPGHYVTGNLYRPKGKTGKLPGVLCPHGHWANGRFYEASEQAAKDQIKQGAEKTMEGARYPLQARCAQLARMGCVVFHYDMVGNADSKQIGHREGFLDAEAELRLQNFMGLQTWNSIRALDFLLSLSEVDPKRIGVTGASGGGTQTFMLCAVDDRPAAAFPAVMVSTAMQGGCICENCSYLRLGTGNIELTALFAPKPVAMSGADDWTIEIEKKGLPELKALYKLYGAEAKVDAKCWPQFKHNYNQVSREYMYNWFNKHLGLGQSEPVVEKPFVPVPPKELSVFDAEHPLPGDSVPAEKLRQYLTADSDQQMKALEPKDSDSLKEFRRVVGTGLRVMVHDRLPGGADVEEKGLPVVQEQDGYHLLKLLLGRKGEKEQVPALGVRGANYDGTVVIWVHPAGKASLLVDGKLSPAAKKILDSKAAILAPDVFWTGEARGGIVELALDADKLKARKLANKDVLAAIDKEKFAASSVRLGDWQFLFPADAAADKAKSLGDLPLSGAFRIKDVGVVSVKDTTPVNRGFAGYTFGYNRSTLANRVHDILTAIAYAKNHQKAKTVHVVGVDQAGPWVVLARGLAGDAVARTAADLNGFRFEKVTSTGDEMMLPGALKYGGLPALAALCAPGDLYLHNTEGTGSPVVLQNAYKSASAAERLKMEGGKSAPEKVVEWLVK